MARNRFAKTKRDFSLVRGTIMPVLFFVLAAGFFWWGLGSVSATTQEEKLASLDRAVTRAVAQCYALEGQYPPDIDYLRNHYGLSFDQEEYLVDYTPIGSNMMPQITVKYRNFGQLGGVENELWQ